MKNAKTKKLGLLMAMLTFCSLAFFLGLGIKQAHAAVTVKLSNFRFIDAAHIQGDINGQTITFYDQNPGDSNHNYSPSSNDVETLNQMGLCQGNINNWGVNLKSTNLTASTVKAQVVFGENNGQGNNNCFSTLPSSAYSPSDIISIQNPNSAATINYMWDSSGDIIGVTGSPTFTAKTGAYINETNSGTCEASGIIVTSSDTTGTLYLLGGVNPRGGNTNPVPNSIVKYLQNAGACQLMGSPTKISIGGTKPANPNNGTGSTSSGDSASSCTDDVSLSWIVCPVINGLSKSADGIDGYVEGQLNFNVQQNLSDSVHKAWTIFRTITSIIIVIVMLVMVFSQAIGGGPFDAYTVRKLLPKLVAAIILMQISWPLCEYVIRLSNDAGQSIGQLLALPFGGPHSLELGALLQRWNEAGAVVVGLATTGGIITSIVAGGFLIKLGWPILVLAMLLIFITLVVAFATLLVRNALIVLLAMTAPLAFIAFVLPGADRYWKMWKDNFIRVLVFFPLVIALIYGGRIFAWIIAGLGTSGPIDLIMILAGFFGPYFFLPKTFKWAGPGVAAAANAINNSWPVKKSREASTKGLMERQQRNLNERAKALNPAEEGYARATKRKFGIPYAWSGNLPKTAVQNLAAGRVIPSKRGLAAAIQRGEQWNADEDAIEAARVKREQDKAATDSNTESLVDKDGNVRSSVAYSVGEDGTVRAGISDNATGRGKAALFNAAGSANERRAGVAVERALKTSSWVELGKNLVPIEDDSDKNPNGLAARIKASGAEIFTGSQNNPAMRKKLFVRMYDLPRYNSKVNASEELYPLPLGKFLVATPHIGNPENYKTAKVLQQEETERARSEGRQPNRTYIEDENPHNRTETVEQINEREKDAAKDENRPAKVLVRPAHIQRAISTIDDYLDAGNITNQSEAEFGEFARLAKQDPDISAHFGALLQRIANGGQGGINVLTQLNSSQSMQGTIQNLLAPAAGNAQKNVPPTRAGVEPTLERYLIEGKQAMVQQPASSGSNGGIGNNGGDNGGTGDGGDRKPRPSGPTGGGGFNPRGPSTAPGNVVFSAPGTPYSPAPQPMELRIDHDALANTIFDASRQGTKEGFRQAMREPGSHIPGQVFRPGGGTDDDEDENKENT